MFFAQGATFAPCAVTIDVVLLFPDRRLVLHGFDRKTTGTKSFIAMRRGGGDDNRQVANAQMAFGVRDIQFQWTAHFLARTFTGLLESTQRQRLEQVVTDAGNRPA